jgi:hypothetical protein
MKKFTSFVTTLFLSVCLLIQGVTPALAQPIPESGLDIGFTTFYRDQSQQKAAVKELQKKDDDELKFGYMVSVPFQLPKGIEIPTDKQKFEDKLLPIIVKMLGDGSFQKAELDFKASNPPYC